MGLCFFAIAPWLQAVENGLDNDLNYLGVSGLYFVPTGTSMDYGEFQFSYANMVDHASYRPPVEVGESPFDGNAFSFALSPFPGLEIGMSNMGYDLDRGSDLIANLKYSPTFIPRNWFDFALGAVDLGGETGTQKALYAAISKEFGRFRLTAGAGVQKQEGTLRRYEGGFSGVEYQPYPWLTAVAEHDGVNSHYGVKVRTPAGWLGGHTQLYGSAVLNSDINDNTDTHYFGLGVRTSLFSSSSVSLDKPSSLESTIVDHLPWLFSGSIPEHETIVKRLPSQIRVEDEWIIDQLSRLKRALTRQGFESVWVGKEQQRLVVRFENSVFNRNDIDALGVVMGLVTEYMPDDAKRLDLTLSKYGIPSFTFETSLAQLKEFFDGTGAFPLLAPKTAKKQKINQMLWVGGSASPYSVPRVSLSPVVKTFIGTELGVFDYSLALRSSFELPVWPGVRILADYDHQLSQSEDFERGRSFFRWSLPSRWTNLAVTKTLKLPLNIYSSVGYGYFKGAYQQEFNGFFGEATWQSIQGAHRFSFNGGLFESTVVEGLKREVAVGKYRYYYDKLDLSVAVEAGQFWGQDRGAKLEFAFNFGDTTANFFVQDTDHTLVGIGFSVPLGLRKDMTPSAWQVKGVESFDHSTSTMVSSDSGCNCLVPGRGMLTPFGDNLSNVFFNGDRSSIMYLNMNKQRLKDAYLNWSVSH